jgi:hypothetical protein
MYVYVAFSNTFINDTVFIQRTFILWEFWGFNSGVVEECVVVIVAVLLDGQLQTSWTSRPLKAKDVLFFETSVAAQAATQRRFPEHITHTYCYM